MKKLIMAVLIVLSTSAAFAGDSSPLKAILKATNYAEASQLLQSTLDQLKDNAEKAKAYHKLYELALKKVTYEQGIQLENEAQKQLGNQPSRKVDEKGLYEAIGQLFDAGLETIKYDNMPNAKGKVKTKFTDIIEPLYNLRYHLINGGIFYQTAKDDVNAYKYLSRYVDTADDPIFASFDKSKDQNLNEIAYFAAFYAFQNKEYKKAEKYVSYALNNPNRAKEAKQLYLAILGSQLKTHTDSIAYSEKLSDMYAKDNTNESVFSSLISIYSSLGMKNKAEKLIDEKLTQDPKSYVALVMKGNFESVRKNYSVAADLMKKALEVAPDENAKIIVNASIGQCLFYKAQDRIAQVKGILSKAAREQFEVVYKEAMKYLLEAKKLDILKENKTLWAYPLYGCYYFVNGPKAPETQIGRAHV